jgi:hypothetical protein
MAHICGDKLGSNRHDPNQSDLERNDYENLILLCPTHHTLIDRKENAARFAAQFLHEMKAEHEARVLQLLSIENFTSKKVITHQILCLLEENRLSWAQFGPHSDLAHSQPFNAAAHAVWISERLSVIVPNNRKIVGLLTKHQDLFDVEELATMASFRVHVRTYEQWVENLIPYAAVHRFPQGFNEFIRKVAHAGSQ